MLHCCKTAQAAAQSHVADRGVFKQHTCAWDASKNRATQTSPSDDHTDGARARLLPDASAEPS